MFQHFKRFSIINYLILGPFLTLNCDQRRCHRTLIVYQLVLMNMSFRY
nr:MAG TPA: hypothetical protein [Caudoviricetes sp.]